jgi:cytoplasmic iron level regulating protein YaaA (DUF328/UPF0246 family)
VLAVLSPAKALDFESPAQAKATATAPQLFTDLQELVAVAQKLDAKALGALMKLSPSLSKLNATRFAEFDASSKKPAGSRPAAFAFDGDTYVGLRAREMDAADIAFAQEHVWILSGLYGVLRPLDAILPYRLEMGSRLATQRGKSLYDFWGSKVATTLKKQLSKLGSQTLVNLASNEYFSVVDRAALGLNVLVPTFKEKKGKDLVIVSFSAKRARGSMARFIVKERITEPAGLKDFSEDGYKFQKAGSTDSEWLFVR